MIFRHFLSDDGIGHLRGIGAQGFLSDAGNPDRDQNSQRQFCRIDSPISEVLVGATFRGLSDHGSAVRISGADWKESDPRSDHVAPERYPGEPERAADEAVWEDR